jgi:hypothetical protein
MDNLDRAAWVTSKGLCQQERGADALVLVFVIEDGEKDAVHRGSVGEDAHWPSAPSDLAEAALDGVGGADGFAAGQGFVAPAGEKLVEIVTQTGDCPRIVCRPAIDETAGRRTCLRQGAGVHDGVQIGLDRRLVGHPHLVEDIADLGKHPAEAAAG